MPIEMPKSVRLAGRVFPIEIRGDDEFCDASDGEYKQTEGLIFLSSRLGSETAKATAIHEIVHDFDSQASLELGEKGVSALGALIFAMMRDNPDLVAWIMES